MSEQTRIHLIGNLFYHICVRMGRNLQPKDGTDSGAENRKCENVCVLSYIGWFIVQAQAQAHIPNALTHSNVIVCVTAEPYRIDKIQSL